MAHKSYHRGLREIKAELMRRGYTQRELARKLRVSEAAVSRGLHGRTKSKRIVGRIARILRTKPEQIERMIYGDNRAAQRRRKRTGG